MANILVVSAIGVLVDKAIAARFATPFDLSFLAVACTIAPTKLKLLLNLPAADNVAATQIADVD